MLKRKGNVLEDSQASFRRGNQALCLSERTLCVRGHEIRNAVNKVVDIWDYIMAVAQTWATKGTPKVWSGSTIPILQRMSNLQGQEGRQTKLPTRHGKLDVSTAPIPPDKCLAEITVSMAMAFPCFLHYVQWRLRASVHKSHNFNQFPLIVEAFHCAHVVPTCFFFSRKLQSSYLTKNVQETPYLAPSATKTYKNHEDWWEIDGSLKSLGEAENFTISWWQTLMLTSLIPSFLFKQSTFLSAEKCRKAEVWTKSQAKAHPSLALTFTPRLSKVGNFHWWQHLATKREILCLIRLFWCMNPLPKPYILPA